jgi:hypothetical protein
MFLSYFSLAVLLIGLMLVSYTFIYIRDIPYEQTQALGQLRSATSSYAPGRVPVVFD